MLLKSNEAVCPKLFFIIYYAPVGNLYEAEESLKQMLLASRLSHPELGPWTSDNHYGLCHPFHPTKNILYFY